MEMVRVTEGVTVGLPPSTGPREVEGVRVVVGELEGHSVGDMLPVLDRVATFDAVRLRVVEWVGLALREGVVVTDRLGEGERLGERVGVAVPHRVTDGV